MRLALILLVLLQGCATLDPEWDQMCFRDRIYDPRTNVCHDRVEESK